MASAAFLPPDRWVERRRAVAVLFDPPPRPAIVKKTELHELAAAAGTAERCKPKILSLADEIHGLRLRLIRHFAAAHDAICLRLSPKPGAEPGPQ